MIKAHDRILENLEEINHDIETKINDLADNHKDLFRSEREITVIIALSHETLTTDQTGTGDGNRSQRSYRHP